MTSSASVSGYTTREVARLLGLSEGQVRSYVRSGFLSPRRGLRREYRFTFQDLVILRAAKALVRARVPSHRVSRALGRLAEQLPAGRSLAGVRISAESNRVVVRREGETWEPESGQQLLDFEVSELAARAAPLTLRNVETFRSREEAPEGKPETSAEDWYGLGLELEATAPERPEEAMGAYRRALELDGAHPDAHCNLGRLLHEDRQLEAAEAHYRSALEGRGSDGLILYNLGVVLQDQGRAEDAIEVYRKVLEVDPRAADAHYNLAGLLESRGDGAAALRHLKTYRRLTRPAS